MSSLRVDSREFKRMWKAFNVLQSIIEDNLLRHEENIAKLDFSAASKSRDELQDLRGKADQLLCKILNTEVVEVSDGEVHPP